MSAGYQSRAAYSREGLTSSYGTAAAVTAQLPLLFETMSQDLTKLSDNDAQSGGGSGGSVVTAIRAGGQLHCAMTYQGLESLLTGALGLSHYHDSPETVAAGVYRHTIVPDHNLHDQPWSAGDYLPGAVPVADSRKIRRGTLCIDKGVSLWEYRSCMANILAIKGDAKGVRAELDLIAHSLAQNTATNPNSAAWSIVSGEFPRVLFADLTLLLAPMSETLPLADPAASVGVRSFALKVDNQLITDEQDSVSGLYITEPQRNADRKRQVTLDLTLPRYTSDTLIAAVASQAPFMAKLTFTGKALASGHNYSLIIWLPCLRLDGVRAPIGGPGLVSPDVTFSAELPGLIPAGFPALSANNEIIIQVISGLSTNPLR